MNYKNSLSFLLFISLFFISSLASAQALSLEEAYLLARKNSPQLKMQEHSIIAAQAQLSEAKYYWAPKFKLTSKFGPMPKEKDITASVDDIWDNILGEWGFTTRNSLEIWIPIFTSLKVYNTRQLAEIGLDVEKLRIEGEVLKVEYDVARAYYGLQLANAGLEVIKEAEDLIKRIETEYQKLLENENSSVKETDQYRIDMSRARLLQLKNEVISQQRYASQALSVHTGLEQPIDILEMDFQIEDVNLKDESDIIKLAQSNRTELKLMLKAEEAARKQAKIQWLQWWPDFILAGEAYYKYSNAVPEFKSDNFFLSDSYNGAGFVAGFVIRWELDPVSQVFKVRRANALADRTSSQRQLAIAGIELEIVKQYQDTLKTLHNVELTRDARRSAKRFMTKEFLDYDSGTGNVNDLISALTSYIELRSSYLYGLHDFRLALVKLKLSTGAINTSQIYSE